MGVQGLWSLIEEAGHPVNIETLKQKVLAIDLSIWINQSIKGFRDKDGRTVENAHLLGLFFRICKLLFYQIKPIVVFDGDCPTLKLHTVQKRLERTRKTLEKSKSLSLGVLENYISSQILSENSKNSTAIVNLKNKLKLNQRNFASELYLPQDNPKQVDVYRNFVELKNDFGHNQIIEDADDEEENPSNESIFVEKSYHHPELQSIHDIDINSEQFKSLPSVTRYEILVELRDSYKQRKATRTELLPQESNSFSEFQMAKLLKKRGLQEEIDKLINELNGKISDENIELYKSVNQNRMNLFDKESSEISSGTLASDEQTRFLLLKKINQAIEEFTAIDENNDSDIKEENRDSQTPIYQVPNSLPGQIKIQSDAERIEILSKSSQPSQLSAKMLSQNIDKNYRKYSTKVDINESMLDLSDDDDDSSSTINSDDFIEVPIAENEDDIKEIFDESVPYDTSYSMDICVENQMEIKAQDNIEKSNDKSENIKDVIQVENMIENSNNLIPDVKETTVESEKVIKEKQICLESNPEPSSISNSVETTLKPEEIQENQPSTSTNLIDITKSPVKNDESNKTASSSKSKISIEELIENSKQSIKLNRQAATVTQQMILECQELLSLFGIPYIVAPAEAEAQCAKLEELQLCEGIITDDSDIFLFGGKNVYRNFFSNTKYIMRYDCQDLEKYYGLDRSKLICLGMLCGTDYTLGIENVGPVTGLEILSQFPGNGIESLEKFAKWHRQKMFMNKDCRENKLKSSFLRKLILPQTFPSRMIYDAYLNANVDQSTEPFSWSMPQLSELREYAINRFGWPEQKTDGFLLPVLKNMNSKQTQKTINFYFSRSSKSKSAISEKLKIKRSKRLNEAIRKNIQAAMKKSDNPQQQQLKRPKNCKKRKTLLKESKKPTQINKSSQLILSEESSSSSD